MSKTATNNLLIPYREGNKWGYCDTLGKIMIDCKYSDVGQFQDGYAWVKETYGWQLMNNEGKLITDYTYESPSKIILLGEKLLVANNDIYNIFKRKRIEKLKVQKIISSYLIVSKEFVKFPKNGRRLDYSKYGVLNAIGDFLIGINYDHISECDSHQNYYDKESDVLPITPRDNFEVANINYFRENKKTTGKLLLVAGCWLLVAE